MHKITVWGAVVLVVFVLGMTALISANIEVDGETVVIDGITETETETVFDNVWSVVVDKLGDALTPW